MNSEKPQILIIDDEPDKQLFRKGDLEEYSVEVTILHPEDLSQKDLDESNLVLVDLRLENWPERENTSSLALKPMNGIALSAVLRSHISIREQLTPKGFAILSAHLADLSFGLPSDPRAHIIARSYNLEWVFSKTDYQEKKKISLRVASLAHAIKQLPPNWPKGNPKKMEELVCELLGLDTKETWVRRAWNDIENCHPPINELYKASHGLAFLRWLLQRILPYPCFLFDTQYLAVRLRVNFQSLEQALEINSHLMGRLNPFKYQGILENFSGNRWWRAGIEDFLWDITSGSPFDINLLRQKINEIAETDILPSNYAQPIVCIDEDYQPISKFYRIEDAVRVQPDDWPTYADQAWTTKYLAQNNPSLSALVVSQDRPLFDEDE